MKEIKPAAEGKQSFIAEARREQIIAAAIQTLDEIGYVKASLSEIAKRAGISTALISYHFSDKSDLMNQLLMKLIEDSTSSIMAKVRLMNTPREKLSVFIEASLAYRGTHPSHNAALLEIIFNARTPENVPYYKWNDGEDDDVLLNELHSILSEGQASGQFSAFNINVMAKMIQGAIGEYMSVSPAHTQSVDLETYSQELAKIVLKAAL
ncbi:TetR/AcrR family transcriptional regulator [Paenibacillus sp. LPE1-1-1.1]|uniref:TetR/AcrR family transcriptional regulator n=1 Tax=Paenibacillus sp. LPE1-1-1.1 TaxID=3135230 RepID=UPI00343C1FAB